MAENCVRENPEIVKTLSAGEIQFAIDDCGELKVSSKYNKSTFCIAPHFKEKLALWLLRKGDTPPAQNVKISFNDIAVDQDEVEQAIKSAIEPLGFHHLLTSGGPTTEVDMLFERDLSPFKEKENA